jgi:peptide/nickel transport system substrate-binding protein
MLLGMSAWAGGGQEGGQEGVTGVMKTGEYTEAPMLAELVAKGELPPLDERLPTDPVVVEVESIGVHGGTLRRYETGLGGFARSFLASPRYYRTKIDGTLAPEVMTQIDLADDKMSATLYLREGIKWSDGEPFDMEDILFIFNDLQGNQEIKTWRAFNNTGATQLSDLSFRVDFGTTYPKAISEFASLSGSYMSIQPEHYLKKWHIDYNDKANDLAKEEGYEIWHEAMRSHFWWSPLTDPDTPVLNPWIFADLSPTFISMVRNPYYIKVDPEGNQLPYIDTVTTQQVDAELFNLKIITGESDIAYSRTSFDNFSLYKEGERANNYTVHEIAGPNHSQTLVRFSLASINPVKAELYSDVKFRQAMSVAINREEINKVVYKGKGVPRQATIKPGVSYYKPEWAEVFAQYDPASANQWLDELGLTKRDADGFRIGSDGKTILTVMEYPSGRTTPAAITTLELIREYWEDVGMKTLVKATDQKLLQEKGYEGVDVGIAIGEGIVNFRVHKWANPWNRWMKAWTRIDQGLDTLEDYADGKLPGVEPPEWAKDYYKWTMQEWHDFEPDSKEYAEVMTKMLDMQAKMIFQIGTVGMVPHLIIAKNYVYNFPRQFPARMSWPGALDWYADKIYIKK